MDEQKAIEDLLMEALAAMKSDLSHAFSKLAQANARATAAKEPELSARVHEEIARAWMRKRSYARAIHSACSATRIAPTRKAAWTTLAKTAELIAIRTESRAKAKRAVALFKTAENAFRKAASMARDPEDKRWLLELAGDAQRAAKSTKAT